MKKLLVMAMAFMLVLSLNSTFVFATDSKIDSVAELKKQISENMKDGCLSVNEKEYLKANTDERTAALFITEKFDEAVGILNDKEEVTEIKTTGTMSLKEIYDLGDGCKLIVELSDMSDNNNSLISPLATSGSSEMWKAYGNRYFTASATVATAVGSVELSLENHYILYANGIDENYGKADYTAVGLNNISISKKSPVITDSAARTPGASDVNMYCNYTIKQTSGSSSSYKLSTKVNYLALDKTNKKIKVGHVWNLTKI